MKFILTTIVLAASASFAASIPPKVESRLAGIPGGPVSCLAYCAPLAEALPAYAACLAACTAAAEEGVPFNETEVVSTKRAILPSA